MKQATGEMLEITASALTRLTMTGSLNAIGTQCTIRTSADDKAAVAKSYPEPGVVTHVSRTVYIVPHCECTICVRLAQAGCSTSICQFLAEIRRSRCQNVTLSMYDTPLPARAMGSLGKISHTGMCSELQFASTSKYVCL